MGSRCKSHLETWCSPEHSSKLGAKRGARPLLGDGDGGGKRTERQDLLSSQGRRLQKYMYRLATKRAGGKRWRWFSKGWAEQGNPMRPQQQEGPVLKAIQPAVRSASLDTEVRPWPCHILNLFVAQPTSLGFHAPTRESKSKLCPAAARGKKGTIQNQLQIAAAADFDWTRR